MRVISTLIVAAAVWIFGVTPAGAQPAITTCALTGVYALTASLGFQGAAQFSGQLAFTPPASCVAGASGAAQLQLSILLAGNPTPLPFTTSLPYSVDASGGVAIGPGLFRGSVGGVAGTGIANSLVFEADPAMGPGIRLAGTAVRVGLAPDIAVFDAHGTQIGRIVSSGGRTADVLLEVSGQTFKATVLRSRFASSDGFFVPGPVFLTPPAFQSSDCTGSALVPSGTVSPSDPVTDLLPPVGIPGGFTAYVADRAAALVSLNIQSYRDFNNVCQTIGSTSLVVYPSLAPIDLSALFTPPFTLR
jgi:hypothetical protein